MGKRMRFRSLSNVFSEMELLRDGYGVREFHFVDDMFNLSRSRVKQFCQILENKRWGISYTFPNGLRLNTIDEDMLSCFKKTGVYGFTVGIESGSQRILNADEQGIDRGDDSGKSEPGEERGIGTQRLFPLGVSWGDERRHGNDSSTGKKFAVEQSAFQQLPAPPGHGGHAKAHRIRGNRTAELE